MKTSQKGSVVVLLSIIIVLIAVAFGVYIYFQNQPSAPVTILPLPTGTSSSTQSTTESNVISVPGMSQYTDPGFGFSFWYPSSWSIKKTDNSIIVGATDNSNPGVTIQETTSAAMRVTDTSPAGPAGDGSLSLTYYFNSSTDTWMAERIDGNNKASIFAADVSTNTMGGLHILQGNARFGDDVVVPLSANNFLTIFSNDVGGGPAYERLVDTIVALNPKVATPASQAQQIKIIQTESETYKEIAGPEPTSPTSPTVITSMANTAVIGGTVTIRGTGRGFYPGQSVRIIFNDNWLAATVTTVIEGNIYFSVPASMGISCTGSGGVCPDDMLNVQPNTYNVSVEAGDAPSNSMPLTIISL